MDIDKAIQFILDSQARAESEIQAARQKAEEYRQEAKENDRRIEGKLEKLTDLVKMIAELQLSHQEENERKHAEYELKHAEANEKFTALIAMMDEWIRNRRNGDAS